MTHHKKNVKVRKHKRQTKNGSTIVVRQHTRKCKNPSKSKKNKKRLYTTSDLPDLKKRIEKDLKDIQKNIIEIYYSQNYDISFRDAALEIINVLLQMERTPEQQQSLEDLQRDVKFYNENLEILSRNLKRLNRRKEDLTRQLERL